MCAMVHRKKEMLIFEWLLKKKKEQQLKIINGGWVSAECEQSSLYPALTGWEMFPVSLAHLQGEG